MTNLSESDACDSTEPLHEASRRRSLLLGFAALGSLATVTAPETKAEERSGSMSAEEWQRQQLDRVAIQEVVQRERVARDMQQWNEMAACYNAHSEVDISWFKGTGAQFAAASEKMAVGGMRTFHQMGPTVTQIHVRRALADTGCAIHILGGVDGVDVDIIGHCRLYARVERQTRDWLLSGLRVVYIQDFMVPFDPSRTPRLDAAELKRYRTSYRYLSYMLQQGGRPARNDLAGTDRPETVKALLEGERRWLRGA